MRTLLNILFAAFAIVLCVGCGEKEEFVADPFYDDTIPEIIVARYVDIPAYVDTTIFCSTDLYTHMILRDLSECAKNSWRDCVGMNIDYEQEIVGVSTEALKSKQIPFYSNVIVTVDVTNRNQFKEEFLNLIPDPYFGGPYARSVARKAYIRSIRVR